MTQDALTVADVEAIVRRIVREELAGKHRPVLTTKTAAVYCGMSTPSLYNLLSQGRGPVHYKHGRRLAFYETDLDAWNDARLTEARQASMRSAGSHGAALVMRPREGLHR